MNSLEFINQKIEKIIFKLIEKVEEREKFAGQYAWTTVDFLNAGIKKLENDRDTLQQIKSELKAWEMMKKRLILEKYGVFDSKDCSVHNYTKIYLKEIKEDENIEEYQTLKKALEVQDESN